MSYRRLKHGEPVPSGTPKRYIASTGYVILRWKVGVRQYVEVLEHRFVAGMHMPEVHHVNRIRHDNRPENLRPMSTIDHGAEHSTINVPEAIDLYRSGWSLPKLAERYGVNNSTVLSCLRLRGVRRRSPAEGKRLLHPVSEDHLRQQVGMGYGTRMIAAMLGETRIVIKNRMRLFGLATRRPGNYTRTERQTLHMSQGA